MNVFTTDHPMTLAPSCFDTKAHPWLSFIGNIFVTTLILTPLVYGYFVYAVVSDDVECTDEPDGPIIVLGIPVTFVFSLICAFLMVSARRLCVRYFRRKQFQKYAEQAV